MSGEYVSPEGREHPTKYDPDQLMSLLVEDAVRHHATDINWFLVAVQRIAARRRRSGQTKGEACELVMKALLDEVEQLTGLRRLPLHSGAIPGLST